MGASDFFSKAMEFSIYALGTAFGIAVIAFSLFEVLRDMFGDLFRSGNFHGDRRLPLFVAIRYLDIAYDVPAVVRDYFCIDQQIQDAGRLVVGIASAQVSVGELEPDF